MKLEVRNNGDKRAVLVLDDKELHHVLEYGIKSSTLKGKAELSLKMLVSFPVNQGRTGGNRPLMKDYISDIKKQAEKVTTAITGAEMREAVSSAFSDTATALETIEASYKKRFCGAVCLAGVLIASRWENSKR